MFTDCFIFITIIARISFRTQKVVKKWSNSTIMFQSITEPCEASLNRKFEVEMIYISNSDALNPNLKSNPKKLFAEYAS